MSCTVVYDDVATGGFYYYLASETASTEPLGDSGRKWMIDERTGEKWVVQPCFRSVDYAVFILLMCNVQTNFL